MPELDWSRAPIHQEIKADWETPEILIEGSLNCAKTTVGLDKEIDAYLKWPGIRGLLFRWIDDDVQTKLKPDLDTILDIRGLTPEWNKTEKCYIFENESRAFLFGLKTQSSTKLFSKIHGLGVSRVLGDQVEEMHPAVASELRGRLRPNLKTTAVTKRRYPFQLTFISNTEDHDFWLSKEFPLDNHIKGRRVFSLSIYDNPYLPQESIDTLIRTYPPDHPQHATMVLGQRGPHVHGTAIFKGLYLKDRHWRRLSVLPTTPILESFEVGKHNPTWVFAQSPYAGGFRVLGGIRGEGLMLEDFLGIVEKARRDWFPASAPIQTCVSPLGPIDLLRSRLRVQPCFDENGNSPDTRLRMIEHIGARLRHRVAGGEEEIGVNDDPSRFLIIDSDGERQSPFVHHAFEAGAVWDENLVSVANKELRQLHEDDKFANAMHCLENIELNFCAWQSAEAETTQTVPDFRPVSAWS